METIQNHCPFCRIESERNYLLESNSAFAIMDKFPVSKGHTLIIPKKHESDYFNLPENIQLACWDLVNKTKEILNKKYNPDGYNVGINIGAPAGQTVFHVHIHLIPRYKGDVEEPRGGIRGVIPGKKNYEKKSVITKEHLLQIEKKYGGFASWAVWAKEDEKPKSNIGDMSIFDLEKNPKLLESLNPNIVMVGLNFSRSIENIPFINFHDKRPQSQDYKIRFAFRNTEFYGAYMTDIIKDFEEKISGKVMSYLKQHQEFELNNVDLFEREINDLNCDNPLIIAFGNDTYNLLNKHFGKQFRIKKVVHYSHRISKENYRKIILQTLLSEKKEE